MTQLYPTSDNKTGKNNRKLSFLIIYLTYFYLGTYVLILYGQWWIKRNSDWCPPKTQHYVFLRCSIYFFEDRNSVTHRWIEFYQGILQTSWRKTLMMMGVSSWSPSNSSSQNEVLDQPRTANTRIYIRYKNNQYLKISGLNTLKTVLVTPSSGIQYTSHLLL